MREAVTAVADPLVEATGDARYLPIAEYALIGDARSAALISRDGSVDWLCWPRFDSRSVFARLLDAENGGFFAVRPSIPFKATRRYVDDTNVLETTFETERGVVRLLDLMPAREEREKKRELRPFRQLLRRVEGVTGSVPMLATFEPRPDYARVVPRLTRRHGDTVSCAVGPEVTLLRSDVPLALIDRAAGKQSAAEAAFEIGPNERRYFALSYETHAPAVFPQIGAAADFEIAETIAFWERWSSQLTYDGPYRAQVLRSALVLKLLTYAPSGGIIAAPTTSLPELIGGIRNWDYRYCWLRDASFTIGALYDCGFETEGGAFADWLLYATKLTQPALQILYTIFGESEIPEVSLEHLDGYRGSKPVRIGNGALDQFQLDVYGEVLGAVEEFTNHGERLYSDTRRMVRRLADMVVKRWQEPDSGIWEKRSERRQHVHAKIMAWSALDCAERLVTKGHIKGDVELWRRTKDEIKRVVLEQGFHASMNSFVSELGGNELDASVLYASRVGFLDGDDPRMLGTIDAIRAALGHDDLIDRYSLVTPDGLPPGEGAFLPCSLWLVEALAIAQRFDEAHALFEKVLARGNDLSLFSEEIDVVSGALLGNFPQALTHIGIMNAAVRLQQPVPSREKRAGSEPEQKTSPGK